MLFPWRLSIVLSTICAVYGDSHNTLSFKQVRDQKCIDDVCSCCIDRNCGYAQGFPDACLKGCIDGHRGARCYELCQYKNCKACGDTGQSKECSACYDGYYLGPNKDCTSQCPSNCKSCTSSTMCTECNEGFYDKGGSTTCRYTNCPANCNCNGQGDCTSCKNEYYDTSTSCTKQCPVNCLACESDAKCSECKKGYYNGYEHDIETNIKLNTCSYTCRESCSQCQSYNNCSQCTSGKYGNMCQDDCSVGCKDKTCSIDNGKCECTNNFSGDKCLECVNERYGLFCNQTCPKDCKGRICERNSGDCTNGCKNANIIGNKCSLCKEGMYGEVCNMTCPKNCKNNKCERDSGICSDGCIVNFNGTKCNECINGKYGEKCERDCPEQCAGNICEKQSGNCFNCNINFRGKKCEECKLKYHGPNCDEPCSARCANFTCNRHTGRCIYGCVSGFSGDRCCAMSENCIECYTNEKCKTCEPGFYKISCNETCPERCNNGSCDILTGECILEKNDPTDEPLNLAAPIAGSVAALTVAVIGVFVLVFFLRRRKKRKDTRNERINNEAVSSKKSGERVETSKERPVYANIKGKTTEEEDLEDVVLDESNENDEDAAAEYYNCDSVNMNVKVADLFSYVTKEHVDVFKNEFKSLPKPDDITLFNIAKMPENAVSNRYNGIYPFDHSRVTIPEEPEFYINACYIDGYNRSRAYIASIGPTTKTTNNFTTFWRMVWHEKSDIIVMLTNLREASGMKCEQYWPNDETQECYGHVNVKCRSVEVFAEYTVRSFTVSKGKEQRNLTHLHFTAWPDKGVPSEVTSLVDFRQRVKAAPVVLDGPVIVHCSAGIGRTGTYIALDILSEQGMSEDSINVFNTVSTMRGQRLNMVQTAEQYIFLHKALVHTLTFGCEALSAEELQTVAFGADRIFSTKFQTLTEEVDHETEEDIAAREENKTKYADKSRNLSDIPGNYGRVRLYLRRKAGSHDYINAVFINSFKFANLFIAAQTPQSNTVEDFLCMIYQQDVSCVVALEDPLQLSKKHDIGTYLPTENETFSCGNFTVKSSKCEIKSQYTMRKLTIKHTDKGEEKVAYHFQYTKWGNGQKVAESPGEFVQFVNDVENYTGQRVVDEPNVAVHCLNGYDRSGLFCVVYTLLEKLEAERKVSVVNVIRKVRRQRKQAISSVEQLKFCYQCISAYLESYNTYSNVAI